MAQEITSNLMDFIVENGIATNDEVCLVTSLNGTTVETLWSIIEVRTGLRNSLQLISEGYEDADPEKLGR